MDPLFLHHPDWSSALGDKRVKRQLGGKPCALLRGNALLYGGKSWFEFGVGHQGALGVIEQLAPTMAETGFGDLSVFVGTSLKHADERIQAGLAVFGELREDGIHGGERLVGGEPAQNFGAGYATPFFQHRNADAGKMGALDARSMFGILSLKIRRPTVYRVSPSTECCHETNRFFRVPRRVL